MRSLDSEAQGSPFTEAAEAMTAVLPPKPGGVLTLLDALPGVDCVFLAHRGLESFAKISSLLSGEVVGSSVDVKLWRVMDPKSHTRTMNVFDGSTTEWSKVDAFVRKLSTHAVTCQWISCG